MTISVGFLRMTKVTPFFLCHIPTLSRIPNPTTLFSLPVTLSSLFALTFLTYARRSSYGPNSFPCRFAMLAGKLCNKTRGRLIGLSWQSGVSGMTQRYFLEERAILLP